MDTKIEVLVRLPPDGRADVAIDFAGVNKGAVLLETGRLSEGLDSTNQAIKLYEQLVDTGFDQLKEPLARAMQNRAAALGHM